MALSDPWVLAAVVATGVVVGVLSGMFGVGGGVIMVPFIVLFLDKGQHVAEGTSLLVVVPTAIAGVLTHKKAGFVDLRSAGVIAVTGIAGGYLGVRLALAIDPNSLQTAFGMFVILVALRLIRDGVNVRRAEGYEEGATPPS